MRTLLLVMLGGAIGTGLRLGVTASLNPLGKIPAGTLAVNLSGSLLIGLLAGAWSRGGGPGESAKLALTAGVLGGFTTFSSLAFEAERMIAAGSWARALGYVAATNVLGVGLALAGLRIGARLAS